MNALLKPIYPSKGEAESWWASLQRALWGSAIVPEPAGGVGEVTVEAAAATQIAAAPSPTMVVSLETVLALVARTAGGAVDADTPLLEAGLDSLGAVELRDQLQQALGEGAPALPSTLVFDHPTARQLAAFLEAPEAPAALVQDPGEVISWSAAVIERFVPSGVIVPMHACVVGAGIVGLCFARDLASLGFSVVIVERRSSVGGTWATNDYPGLRLHSSGSSYRCLSVAPAWTKQHPAESHYRPTRDEVLSYCHELADHPKITLLLNCETNPEQCRLEGGWMLVPAAEARYRCRFLFISVPASSTKFLQRTQPI